VKDDSIQFDVGSAAIGATLAESQNETQALNKEDAS